VLISRTVQDRANQPRIEYVQCLHSLHRRLAQIFQVVLVLRATIQSLIAVKSFFDFDIAG